MTDKTPLTLHEAVRAITSTPRMRHAEEPKLVREHGPEPAKVFEDRENPGQWRVEWLDDDGHCELEIFSGPSARRDALRYAMRMYGHFREVQLSRIGKSRRPALSKERGKIGLSDLATIFTIF
jgi:hypothetical protein